MGACIDAPGVHQPPITTPDKPSDKQTELTPAGDHASAPSAAPHCSAHCVEEKNRGQVALPAQKAGTPLAGECSYVFCRRGVRESATAQRKRARGLLAGEICCWNRRWPPRSLSVGLDECGRVCRFVPPASIPKTRAGEEDCYIGARVSGWDALRGDEQQQQQQRFMHALLCVFSLLSSLRLHSALFLDCWA